MYLDWVCTYTYSICDSNSIHIERNFFPVHVGVQPFYKTAADLASAPVMPDVVACRSVTLDNQGQVIRPGTVLFPVTDKKGMKQKLKIGGQKPIKFLSTRGEKLKVPLDSESGFTTHLEDTKMYISEIIQHFPLPVKVRCMTSGKNFLGTSFLNELTLKETKEEASLIGGFKLDEGEEDFLSKCPFDLPLDLLVEVVCVKAHDNNEQFSMYEEVRTTYESKRSRVAPYKKLLSNCNTHDRAQMELYNTVREEMSEHVVDVEVPENIYDEIIPYECVGTSKPPPKNTGPSLPPKGIKPDMDYVQLTKSTPEKDPSILNAPQQPHSPGSYQPLQPMPSTYIESAYQPLNNKVPSEETTNAPTSDKVERELPATARQLQEEYPDYDIPRCHPLKKKTSADDDMERKITPPSTKQPPPVLPKTKKTPPPAPIRRSSELSQETKEKPPTAPRPTFVRRHSEKPSDTKDKPPQICAEHTPSHIPPQPLARQIMSQSPPPRVLPQLSSSHAPFQSPPSHASLQSPPSHVPPQSPATHIPPQSPATHIPPQSPATHIPPQSPATHIPPQSPATHIPPQSPATHIPQQPPIMTPNPPNPEENIAFLKTLDCHSILDLIHVMKLSQYQDQFIQVSGLHAQPSCTRNRHKVYS